MLGCINLSASLKWGNCMCLHSLCWVFSARCCVLLSQIERMRFGHTILLGDLHDAWTTSSGPCPKLNLVRVNQACQYKQASFN